MIVFHHCLNITGNILNVTVWNAKFEDTHIKFNKIENIVPINNKHLSFKKRIIDSRVSLKETYLI